jgi:ribosomal protein L40E
MSKKPAEKPAPAPEKVCACCGSREPHNVPACSQCGSADWHPQPAQE